MGPIDMNSQETQRVLVARIGAAHGIRGEVRVKSFTDDPLSFGDYGPLMTADGSRTFEVVRARMQKTVVVTKFREIDDRNTAEALNGTDLFIERGRLPAPDEDEFYYEDLAGLEVRSTSGEQLGRIVSVQDFGAGDLLEVRPPRGPSYYVPFTRDFVPTVAVTDGYVVVDLPEDYLSEERSRPGEPGSE